MSDDPYHDLYADETERALLASILTDPTVIGDVLDDLDTEMFWRKRHRHIWRAIESCVMDGVKPDYVAVSAELSSRGLMDAIDGGYLANLQHEFPQEQQVRVHADQLVELYRRRELFDQCSHVRRKLNDREYSYDEARESIDEQLRDHDGHRTDASIGEASAEVLEDVDRKLEGDVEPYDSCGVWAVDKLMGGGFTDGRFSVLAARPKHGKTSLALRIIAGLIERHDYHVDIWYGDGAKRDIAVALQSYLTGIENRKIMRADLTDEEREELGMANDALQSWPIQVHAPGRLPLDRIYRTARTRSAAADGNYLCMVDYLQKVDAGVAGDRVMMRSAERASIVCSSMAAELDCVVLGLAQFNRQAEDCDGLPSVHHLRYSGQIEQDANNALVWHRPRFQDEDGGSAVDQRFGQLRLALSKHRSCGGEANTREVDAQLGVCDFQPWDVDRVVREENYDS